MYKKIILLSAISFFVVCAIPVHAETTTNPNNQTTVAKARVTSIVSEAQQLLPGIDQSVTTQKLRATILDGVEAGSDVEVLNDVQPAKIGDVFYLVHRVDALDATDVYTYLEPYRLPNLIFLGLLFLVVLICFGGMQGIRGLVALALSLAVISYVLLPGVLGGYPILLLTIGVAAVIIVLGSYVTHGFNRVTTSAVLGMLATISVTAVLAYVSIDWLQLTGFADEEAVYLNLGTGGTIDFAGLLLGGMLIGILGVLYDAAIGQSVAVDELFAASPTMSKTEAYRRALRIGREHIGALVNTLAIAYVGVSLPLLLLFYTAAPEASLAAIVNREIFTTEIARMLIGSIGIVLTVPVSTAIAVALLGRAR